MSDPIAALGCRVPDPDLVIGQALGVRADASLSSRADQGPSSPLVNVSPTAAEAAAFAVDAFIPLSAACSLGVTGLGLAVGAMGYGLTIQWTQDEANRLDLEYQRGYLRGALHVLSGRTPQRPDDLLAPDSRGYADGVASARFLHRIDPARYRQIVDLVRACDRGGRLAVAEGNDRGPAFEARYAQDPAFRNGVDDMRQLRADDPALYAEQAAALSAVRGQLEAGRCSKLPI